MVKKIQFNDEKSAIAFGRMMRISVQKLNLVAQLIRGHHVKKADALLKFCTKGVAADVKKVLNSAVANADHNFGLDVGNLYVREASVGRAAFMRRIDIKGRGRTGRIEKPLSHLRIIVSEKKD